MIKKKYVLSAFFCMLTCVFMLLLSFFTVDKVMKVIGEASEGRLLEMETGVSLKISEEGGIRFRVKMNEEEKSYIVDNDNVTLHFLVAPHEFYNNVDYANGAYDYYNGLRKKKIIDVDESKIYEEDGYYWANGCVTNILELNRELDFTLLAYTYDASTSQIEYASVNSNDTSYYVENELYNLNNIRGSLCDILSQAVVYTDENGTDYMNDIFACEAYKTWFGTESYPIQINDLAMYNALVEKINAGVDFSSYTISVLDKVPQDGRAVLDEGKVLNSVTSYLVKFCNEDGSLYKKYILKEGETLVVPNGPAKNATIQYEYTFNGWDMNSDGTADDVVANVTESITYQAVYTSALNQYTITFDCDGGTEISIATVDYGTSMSTFYTELYQPTKKGYVFDGWYVGEQKVLSTDIVCESVTLKAHYQRIDGVSMPTGQNTSAGTAFIQSIAGLPTEFAEGTAVQVEMDVYVTGTLHTQYTDSRIVWIDSVNDSGVATSTYVGSAREETIKEGEWVHLSFEAKVRNFSSVRVSTEFNAMDTSAYGNAVYIAAYYFQTTTDTFNYKNVEITEAPVSMPAGQKKSDNFMQSAVGLSTDLAEGTKVQVEMDIYVTGKIYAPATSIVWVDSVDSTTYVTTKNTTIITGSQETNPLVEGEWIHLSFEATVRNFTQLRLTTDWATMDMSAYGNAVYIAAAYFNGATTTDTFNYKNVEITEIVNN